LIYAADLSMSKVVATVDRQVGHITTQPDQSASVNSDTQEIRMSTQLNTWPQIFDAYVDIMNPDNLDHDKLKKCGAQNTGCIVAPEARAWPS